MWNIEFSLTEKFVRILVHLICAVICVDFFSRFLVYEGQKEKVYKFMCIRTSRLLVLSHTVQVVAH